MALPRRARTIAPAQMDPTLAPAKPRWTEAPSTGSTLPREPARKRAARPLPQPRSSLAAAPWRRGLALLCHPDQLVRLPREAVVVLAQGEPVADAFPPIGITEQGQVRPIEIRRHHFRQGGAGTLRRKAETAPPSITATAIRARWFVKNVRKRGMMNKPDSLVAAALAGMDNCNDTC